MTTTTEFFSTDYVDYASYDNLRKICSYVDGLKNTSRKIIATIIRNNINKEHKVLQLASKMSEQYQYLHGDASGVIVTLAQHHIGSNNLPLLKDAGEFGSRFEPIAAAPRYIFTHKESYFNSLFNDDDSPVLKHQTFEGEVIEPIFFIPTLPLILVNGSEGISPGFAQKILPRKVDGIKKSLINFINGKSIRAQKPHYNGFRGTISKGDGDSKWLISGSIKLLSMNKVEITELPIGYTLKSYVNILNGLEDSKVLKSFEDRSDNDQFNFIVDFSRGVIRDRDEGFILDTLKLVKKVSENFTTIDQDNKIKVFNNDVDLLKAWVDIKLTYTLKRKKYMLSQMQHEGELLTSRYIFIKSVIDGDIIVTNTKKCDIIKQIKKVNGVIEKDGLYDYLLNMPIHSLTKEKVTMLKSKIKVLMVDTKSLKRKTEQELYMEDLDQL